MLQHNYKINIWDNPSVKESMDKEIRIQCSACRKTYFL